MKFRTILGLLIVLIGCSGNQQTSEGELPIEKGTNQDEVSNIGLKIENRINHGARYTASDSTDYWLIHIASTITNDSTIPIHLQMAFSREYDYPNEYGDQKFNIFLLPKVFALDGVTKVTEHSILTDSMQVEFRNYIGNGLDNPYLLNKTLEPGEKCVVPIGTQFPVSSNCGVFPNVLLSQSESANFQVCENQLAQDESTNPQLALGLKLDFRPGKTTEKCTIIPCGQISYLER